MNKISTMISPLEISAPQEIFLVSEIPTDVYLLSRIGAGVTPEKRIPRKQLIWNHQTFSLQQRIQLQIKIVPELSSNKIQTSHHIYQKNISDINYLLMLHIFQILQKTNIIVIQIIHVLITKIPWMKLM